MSATAEQQTKVQSFTVELGDERNRQINVPMLHETFRGAYSVANLRGQDIGSPASSMPDIPGMQLTIDARNRRVIIRDPLKDNEALCSQIAGVLKKRGSYGLSKLTGCDERTVAMDEHEMKTLVRFVVKLLDPPSGLPKAKLVKGRVPTDEEVDQLPGEYLYDPGSETQHGPKFEKDAQQWFDRVNRNLA